MAVPTSYTGGTRTTQTVTDTTKRDVDKDIIWLQPNRAPFISLMGKLGQEKKTVVPKYEFFEDDMIPAFVKVNGALSDSATSLVVDDASYTVNGVQLYNKTSKEAIRVTGVDVPTNTLTIVRAQGGTTAAAIADNEELILASEGREEGVQLASAISTNITGYFNYIEEFETAVQMTWLQQGVETYTEYDWDYQLRKGSAEHKEKIERAFWFGHRDKITSGPNGQVVYYTGGVKWWIDLFGAVSNSNVVKTVTGPLKQLDLEDWVEFLFRYGDPNRKAFFTSPFGKMVITRLAQGKVEVEQSDDTLGMSITKMNVLGYKIPIIDSLMFPRVGMNDHIFCVDMGLVKKRILSANGMNFGTQWHRQVQTPDLKARKDVLHSICGLDIKNELAHGYLKGFSG